MSQFTVGRYKTKSGLEATVACLKEISGEWMLKGTINYPETNVGIICAWHLDGHRFGAPPHESSLDLTREEKEAA